MYFNPCLDQFHLCRRQPAAQDSAIVDRHHRRSIRRVVHRRMCRAVGRCFQHRSVVASPRSTSRTLARRRCCGIRKSRPTWIPVRRQVVRHRISMSPSSLSRLQGSRRSASRPWSASAGGLKFARRRLGQLGRRHESVTLTYDFFADPRPRPPWVSGPVARSRATCQIAQKGTHSRAGDEWQVCALAEVSAEGPRLGALDLASVHLTPARGQIAGARAATSPKRVHRDLRYAMTPAPGRLRVVMTTPQSSSSHRRTPTA